MILRKCAIWIVGLLLLLISPGVWSQSLSFRNLTVENGLSQNAVMAIAQDHEGFLWIGTRYGLNRYDGTGFRTYKYSATKNTSLSDNLINALLVDDEGVLWVGTSNGLNKYDRVKDNFERLYYDPKQAQTLNNSSINCLYQDRQKRIWVGTKNGLNLLSDRAHNKFLSAFGKQRQVIGNSVRTVFQSSDGMLWVGTATGLIRVRISEADYAIQAFLHDRKNPASISGDFVTSIVEDAAHRLWIGTQHNGLNEYRPQTSTFIHLVQSGDAQTPIIHNNIRKLLIDRSGKLWIGTQDGLTVYDISAGHSLSYQHDPEIRTSLSNNSIHSIYQDAGGTMWVGTYHGGINFSYLQNHVFTTHQNTRNPNSLSNNVVSSIIMDKQHALWVGTEGGGVNILDPARNAFRSFKNNPGDSSSLSSNLVKIIYRDRSDHIWVGTSYGGGLNLYDPRQQRFRHIAVEKSVKDPASFDEVLSLLEDSKGNFWVGSLSGLTVLKQAQGDFESRTSITPLEAQLHNKTVHALFEDSKQRLWIGTSAGLHLLNNHADKLLGFLQNENDAHSLQADFINCIMEDSRHQIWIGTYYGGLSRYNEAQQNFTTFTDKEGLPNNNVLGILEDAQHNLWISTDNGLSRFNPADGSFKNYTTSDGLTGNKFNNNAFFLAPTGEMYFGGNNGFNGFFPSSIQTNTARAALVFTGLKLFGNPVSIHSDDKLLAQDIGVSHELRFRYDQNTFTIEFALLNFIKPEKNRYAYMLKGLDKDWTLTSNTFASYNNLPPGDYTFLVKAANNDGIWMTAPSGMHVRVLPPFWKTWWAYLIYAVVLISIIVITLRFFWMRALYKREYELHQFKLNFFTNVSHEIKTHLTLISAPVEKLLDHPQEGSSVTRLLQQVKNNANRLLQLVGELMDFRKAETNNLQLHVQKTNLVILLEEIIGNFRDQAASRKIALNFHHPTTDLDLYFDPRQMEKVVFNLLTNAFKFTPDGGAITMQLRDRKTSVELEIADNGKGIAPEHLKRLFLNFFQVNDEIDQNTGYGIGLALAKSIIDLHGGDIEVVSEPADEGRNGHTIFTVTLPKGRGHFTADQLRPSEAATSSFVEHLTGLSRSEELAEMDSRKPLVLLVEDNQELRQFIHECLHDQYEILESINGVEGVEQATTMIPELIISDVMMPEMNGLELVRRLKADERTNHIPIILLTAKTSEENQVDGWETGVDAYITKPFSIRALELQVRNLISARMLMRKKFSRQILLEPTQTVIDTAEGDFLKKLVDLIEEHLQDPQFGVPMLCTMVGMSQPVLYKKLKALTDMSVNDLIKSIRLKKAAQMLLQSDRTVYEIANAVGYTDRKYFSQEFKKQFGKTPSDYATQTTS